MRSLDGVPHMLTSLSIVLHVFNLSTRYQDGFDLDVAYVTKRIIVHGVPNVSAGKIPY